MRFPLSTSRRRQFNFVSEGSEREREIKREGKKSPHTAVRDVAGPAAIGAAGADRSSKQLVPLVTGVRRQGSVADGVPCVEGH